MYKFLSTFLLVIAILLNCNSSFAASTIRDAEIEELIKRLSKPIFDAAGLHSESINIYIVNDNDINAFVSGGQNMFINTGLLQRAASPDIIVGVIAHETGHIAEGHLIKSMSEFRDTSIKASIGYAIGLVAAAAGAPEVGTAIAHGTGHIAQRQMLKFTRSHEEAADQAALKYLDRLHIPPTGLVSLLTILNQEQITNYGQLNPYTLTHPLSRERISAIEDHIKNSGVLYKKYSDKDLLAYKMAVAKLDAFLGKPEEVLQKYQDDSTASLYAKSIAYYRIPDLDKAFANLDKLIAAYPQNPYFVELKGQILFENGRIKESVPYYLKSVELGRTNALLQIQAGSAMVDSEDPAYLNKAIDYLKQGLIREKYNAAAWHKLAKAYNSKGEIGLSNLSLAEEALLNDDKDSAKLYISNAKSRLKEGTPAALRLKDLEMELDK